MFNNQFLSVLSQVNNITNTVILKYPNTVAVSDAGDILMNIDVTSLDSDHFPDLGLMDNLSDFLSLFKLFPNDTRDVSISDNAINVSEGKSSSVFITDNIALMDAFNRDPVQFDKTEQAPSVATFKLTSDDMKSLKQASGVFKDLNEIIITSQDGDINLSLGSTSKFNAKSNSFSINKEASTSKEFQIKLPVENFKSLPNSNYTLSVKYNSAKDDYRILLSNDSINLKILMSLKV